MSARARELGAEQGPGTEHDQWPNVITRITPTYLDVINWFRAAYP